MTLNCLTLSKVVLSLILQAYYKIVKDLFPLHVWWPIENTVETLVQAQFYKFFTSVLYTTHYLKHSQTLFLLITMYQANIVPKVSFLVASDVVSNVCSKPWRLLSFNAIIQIWNTWENVSESICKHFQARKFKNCKKWTPAYKGYWRWRGLLHKCLPSYWKTL